MKILLPKLLTLLIKGGGARVNELVVEEWSDGEPESCSSAE